MVLSNTFQMSQWLCDFSNKMRLNSWSIVSLRKKMLFDASFKFLCLKQPENLLKKKNHYQGLKKLTITKKWIWIHMKVCPIDVFSVIYLQLLLLMLFTFFHKGIFSSRILMHQNWQYSNLQATINNTFSLNGISYKNIY